MLRGMVLGARMSLLAPDFDAKAVFLDEFDKAVKEEAEHSGFAPIEWYAAGRGKGEDQDWWYDHGPGLVESFITWYESREDVAIWITPEGIPAIELPFALNFGKIPVRGYIDLILAMGRDAPALVVVDLKSGSRKPENPRQLAIYASAVEAAYGIRPRYGAYFMARGTAKPKDKEGPKDYLQTPVPLWQAQYSLGHLTREFEMFDLGVKGGVFPANPGENCRRCPVAYACMEVNGPKARELDPNWPGYRRNR